MLKSVPAFKELSFYGGDNIQTSMYIQKEERVDRRQTQAEGSSTGGFDVVSMNLF